VAVTAQIVTLERDANRGGVIARRDRHFDVVALAAVAHLHKPLEAMPACAELGGKGRGHGRFHSCELGFEVRERRFFERLRERDGVVQARVGEQHAGGRKRAGLRWDHDCRDRQFVGQR
jgi:hypothetical protein